MEIDCDWPTRCEYVSWWPSGSNVGNYLLGLGTPAALHTFDDDCDAEGWSANYHLIRIFGLDEPAMLSWWDAWQRDPTFRLYQRNCSTTVMAGLHVGAGGLPIVGLCTPFDVYLKALILAKIRRGL